tara:strand:- start:13 stop:417 length:405 start_codon:yes stop_codon:yes gene_type:complete
MKQFRDSKYWVSKDGEVFRYFPKRVLISYPIVNGKKYTQEKTKPEMWKQLKPGIQSSGYKQVVFWKDFLKPTTFRIHRLIAEVYVPGYFEGAHVDHIDCNPMNNHYTNLQWCTKEYNHQKRDNPNYPLFVSSDG